MAVILLLAMLGHGLLMTSAAAAPACQARAATVAAPGPNVHCADHDAGCFTVVNAASSATRPLAPLAAMTALLPSEPARLPRAELNETPPGRPPRVTRALLQVYRN